jgi:FkbM family methyltransferase
VILDIGANAGQTTIHCQKLLPGCRVYSFEPGPAAYAELEATVGSIPGVEVFNVAMGERRGRLRLIENSISQLSSFFGPGAASWGEVVGESEAEVWTVDEFRESRGLGRISVLKTDTQGYDLAVLRGAGEALAESAVDFVLTELTFAPMYVDAPRFDGVVRFLLDRDFRLVGLYNLTMQRGTLEYADALFAHQRVSLG